MDQSLVICGTLLSANCRKVLAVAKQLDLKIILRGTDVYKGQGQQPEYNIIKLFGLNFIILLTDIHQYKIRIFYGCYCLLNQYNFNQELLKHKQENSLIPTNSMK